LLDFTASNVGDPETAKKIKNKTTNSELANVDVKDLIKKFDINKTIMKKNLLKQGRLLETDNIKYKINEGFVSIFYSII
jgi:hypothetical protein